MRSEISYIRFLLVALLFQTTFLLHAQDDRKYIRQGNGKYSGGKFPEAEILYRKAINNNKTSADAGFNVGDALYRQNKFEEAAKQFQGNAGEMADASKKSDSYYNLGNSLVKAKKYEEAISAYKNSLKLVPGNINTKYNLAYAQDQLTEQKKKKDQEKDKNKDQNKNQNKDQGKDQDKKKNQEQNKDQQNNKDPQSPQNPDKNQDQKQQQKEGNISKDDAQRLLDALANDEKNVQEKVKEAKAAKAKVRTLKNW
jgi:Ca-activated chloride channel family protein